MLNLNLNLNSRKIHSLSAVIETGDMSEIKDWCSAQTLSSNLLVFSEMVYP